MQATLDKLRNRDLGLLVIRIGLGAAFLAHGVAKLQSMDGTISFFASLGFPAFLAWLVAIVETVGGLAVLLGLWVELAGALLAIVMVVAIIKVKFAKGYLGGYELDSLLLMMSLAMIFSGAGKYSLAAKMGAKKKGPEPGRPAMERPEGAPGDQA